MDSMSQITSHERLYQHTPLREHTSTRLLSLLPGEHGTPLQCEITECEDSFNTSYEALSYTWGEPEFPKVIHVNDSSGKSQYIRITQNLYNALQRLRKVDAPRSMWIDALCIDQADLQEKGHQVAHMGQIFRRADRVVIWLGDTGDFPLFETWVEQDMMRKSMEGKPMSRCGFLDIPWYVCCVDSRLSFRPRIYQQCRQVLPCMDCPGIGARRGRMFLLGALRGPAEEDGRNYYQRTH